MKKKGFTLVELLAVIAIIAILAVTAVAGYNRMTAKSKENAYQAKIKLIEKLGELLWGEGLIK